MAETFSGSSDESAAAKAAPKSNEEILVFIRENYRKDSTAVQENHDEALDDLRFKAGDQWDWNIKRQREKKQRPCLTIDHVSQHVRQVTGDIRLNKPAIRVRPVDDEADTDTAELFTGLIRNIEQQSMAGHVYSRAGDNAATCGEGAFRIVTEYADDDVFDQDIRLEAINNPLAVIWDRNARKPTMEDAMHCWVLERYSMEAFKAKWPEASTADFEAEHPEDWVSEWYTNDTVLVAEFWHKETVTRQLVQMPDGSVGEWDKLTSEERDAVTALQELTNPGIPLRFRNVETHKVVRYVINGAEVLTGPEEWPGRDIPVIPVFGEEIWVGDERVRRGMVRMAKDPQRMINYHASAAVESVALAPKSPFIGTADQFKNYEDIWETANTENYSYLPYNADGKAPGPPQRSPGPQPAVATIQLKQEAINDLNNATGIHPASLGQASSETSGRAILARERQGDVGTFVYIDNLAMAIGYAGRQLVDLIPKIYDGERVVRVLGEDDTEELMQVNALQADGSIVNDLSRGKYDVIVRTGPSFSTKRQESAEAMMQFIQTAPDAAGLVMDLIAKNMDWPGADDIAARFRKQMIAQGIVEADPEKGEEPPGPPPPTPEEIKAQTDAMQAEADVAKKEAETRGQELENAEKTIELLLASGTLERIIEGITQEKMEALREAETVIQFR